CPAEIAAGSDRADLLNLILPDISQQHASRRAVPGEALRIAHPIGIDVGQSVASSHKGVGVGNSVFSIFALAAEGVDTQDLAEVALQVLTGAQGVAPAAAIADADVQEAKVLVAGSGQRIEADLAAIVVGEGLGRAEHFRGCLAVIAGGRRVAGGPLQQEQVVASALPAGDVVGLGFPIGGIYVGVELAIAGAAALGELRMEGEALQAALTAG